MKKLIYNAMIACLVAVGFVSCSPQESDDHSLGNANIIPQDALSWTVVEDETETEATYTFTNTSKEIAGVSYTVSTNGKSIAEFPIGSSVSISVKKNGTNSVSMYATARGELKELTWTKTVDWIPVPDVPEEKQWVGYTEGTNLLEGINPSHRYWFANDSWSQIADPEEEGDLVSGLTITKNETGGSQWMAQLHIEDYGITLSSGKTYDFSIAIESSADFEGDGVTVKPQQADDDNTFFSDARHEIKKGLNVISLANQAGFDGQFKIALDFAGAPTGTLITIRRIFLTEHNDANVTGDTWAFDYSSDINLLKGQPFGSEFRFWFADGGWSQIGDPEFEGDVAEFKLTIPEGIGPDQWQGQVHIPFDDVTLSAGKTYDLSLVVISDGDIPGLTVKAQNDADDNAFLTADRHSVAAKVPTAVTLTGLEGFDGKLRMCLDFGGTAAGTHVSILGMYVGEHK